MFAGDVSSFSDSVSQLQRQIDKIETFSSMVGMRVNINKTKIMVFRNGGVVRKNEKWFNNNKPIEIVSFYKYLGLFILLLN